MLACLLCVFPHREVVVGALRADTAAAAGESFPCNSVSSSLRRLQVAEARACSEYLHVVIFLCWGADRFTTSPR